MVQTSEGLDCPTLKAMKVIGGKWKIPIIFNLSQKTHRFGELKRSLCPAEGSITQQMLSKQLKELEDDHMLKRKVFAEVPPRVEYSLTEKGRQVLPVITALYNWSTKHLA